MESPSGAVFEAKWIKSPRRGAKKLGAFDYPEINGTVYQDQGLASLGWPLQFFFDGPDHDKESDRFVKATGEDGPWAVTHPIYGPRGLQLMSWEEMVDPTNSGNIRGFETEWVEGIDPSSLKTTAEMLNLVGLLDVSVDISSAQQFSDGLGVLGSLNIASITSAMNKVTTAVDTALGPLTNSVAAIQKEMLAIQRGIQDVLHSGIIKPLSLAGQIQNLIKTPLRAITDVKSRLNSYADLAAELFLIQPAKDGSETNQQGRNVALVQQTSLLATVGANALICATPVETSGLKSQKDAISTAEQINGQYLAMVSNMEESQEVFDETSFADQHFSQEQSYYDSLMETAQAMEYLMASSFDLKKERIITLQKGTTPIEIATIEYGGLGPNDENLDLFLESNDLHGEDILFLMAGRTVKIYA